MDFVNACYWTPEFRTALTPVDQELERLSQYPETEIAGPLGQHLKLSGKYSDFLARQPEVNHPSLHREGVSVGDCQPS